MTDSRNSPVRLKSRASPAGKMARETRGRGEASRWAFREKGGWAIAAATLVSVGSVPRSPGSIRQIGALDARHKEARSRTLYHLPLRSLTSFPSPSTFLTSIPVSASPPFQRDSSIALSCVAPPRLQSRPTRRIFGETATSGDAACGSMSEEAIFVVPFKKIRRRS
ncbi:hypothetical protein MRX96_025646 [Rhipicephalus microplus]